jgi:hypothetical protein
MARRSFAWLVEAIMPLLSTCYANTRGRNDRDSSEDQSAALLQGVSKALCAGLRTLPLLSMVSHVVHACEQLGYSTRDREREVGCTLVLHALIAVMTEWRQRGKVVTGTGSDDVSHADAANYGVRASFVNDLQQLDGASSSCPALTPTLKYSIKCTNFRACATYI